MTFHKLYKKESDIIICYNIATTNEISDTELYMLKLFIKTDIEIINHKNFVEYGPHLHVVTGWSSNCQSVLDKIGVKNISRIEKTYLVPKNLFSLEMVDPVTETIYKEPLSTFGGCEKADNDFYEITDIEKENLELRLGFDKFDIEYYKTLYSKLGRNPTNIELHDLAQSNSEHARHWFFKGNLIDPDSGMKLNKSLFQMVKDTQKYTNNNSLVAFHDNSSVFRGFEVDMLTPQFGINKYNIAKNMFHFTFTAETHNFPTSVCPFQGATTGTGGRIRDNQSVGRGGIVVAGIAGYCVGELDGLYQKKNLKTLLEASDGASDYGNKFGEPVILGFMRTFGVNVGEERVEWVKPIMFSGGVGLILDAHVKKEVPEKDMFVVKVGGPAFRIGLGGGAASSQDQDTKNINTDLNAVQRGDPEMENKMNRVIRTCIELGENNPICSINDQGAGGTANVTKEIVYPNGADIHLDKIVKGDNTMSALELWVSEYQENNTVLVRQKSMDILQQIALRENVHVSVIGCINDSKYINVYNNNKLVMNLPLKPIVGKMPKKTYVLDKTVNKLPKKLFNYEQDILLLTEKVLSQPTVGSKRFLTNKVDRSVTGLVAQQQCVGPLQMPLSDYSIIAQSYFSLTGCVTSIGEQPIKGLLDPSKMARLALCEMLTNMVFAKITKFENIRFSANWMWPASFEGEKHNVYLACSALCEMAKELGIACDRGKDSLSMSYKDSDKTIKCPGSLVVTGYGTMENINLKITPHFKKVGSLIYYLSFNNSWRLGGSIMAHICGELNNSGCPDIFCVTEVKSIFNKIQQLVADRTILAGHDVSDGGLITCICEMAFAGNLGVNIKLPEYQSMEILFSEEPGLVMEISKENSKIVESLFGDKLYCLGYIVNSDLIDITNVFSEKMSVLRTAWEKPSFEMEKLQKNLDCVKEEYEFYKTKHDTHLQYNVHKNLVPKGDRKYKVAIIRDEGTNGDRELAAAFYTAGFDTYDLCMNDFLNTSLTLEAFSGIAFAGGFSYSDVCGAGQGWAQVLKSAPRVFQIFNDFKNRPDTFSLGICNGCQLMSLLNWVPDCRLVPNKSGKFESRCIWTKISGNKSIMFKEMDDIVLPIWIAHGEGQFVVGENVEISLQYVDNLGCVTEQYPHNPNGSKLGVAGVCSDDGRHIAMMPHPERCFLNWQIPYDCDSNCDLLYSPWLQMFMNAYDWCKNVGV